MFNPTHTLNELCILTKLNWRKHALMLLIYAMYVAFIHYFSYKAAIGITHMLLLPYHILTTAPLVVIAIVVSLDIYKQLRDPVGGIQYLLNPSSTLDKFTASWLYSFILTFVAFVVTYNLSHALSVLAFNLFTSVHFTLLHSGEQLSLLGMSTDGMPFLFQNWNEFNELALVFMGTQASFMLGSAFFKKNPFFKTVLILIGLSVLKSIVAYFILQWYGIEVFDRNRGGRITLQFPEQLKQTMDTVGDVFNIVTPLVAWYLTYVVLKRKEV